MKASREKVKILIELSPTIEEADKVINENYNFESVQEKVAFLKGMFNITNVAHEDDEPNKDTYFAMLNTIINGYD